MDIKTENEIPKVNVLVILLIIGLLISFSTIFIEKIGYLYLFREDQSQIVHYNSRTQILLSSIFFLKSILNIVIAFWLYTKAKLQKENSLIWFLFGAFFGPIALILFYVIILTKEVKEINYLQ